MTTTAPAASDARSDMYGMLERNFVVVMNCLQNVVNVLLLANFVELGLFYSCMAAKLVSPAESWKGLCYNVFFCLFVLVMIKSFQDTLEALILFENFKRNRETKEKEATTTIIAVGKDGANVKHVDHGSSTNTAWQTIACYILGTVLGAKYETKMENGPTVKTPDASTKNNEGKAAADDAATSVSSSTRSSADTADALLV